LRFLGALEVFWVSSLRLNALSATMVILDDHEYLCDEEIRLKEDRERTRYWKKWGPYVAERQWATGTLIF
jgi:hypothetical protein